MKNGGHGGSFANGINRIQVGFKPATSGLPRLRKRMFGAIPYKAYTLHVKGVEVRRSIRLSHVPTMEFEIFHSSLNVLALLFSIYDKGKLNFFPNEVKASFCLVFQTG